jgi:hypothetical protein
MQEFNYFLIELELFTTIIGRQAMCGSPGILPHIEESMTQQRF